MKYTKRLTIHFAVLLLASFVGVASAYLFHKSYIQFECIASGSLHAEPEGYGGFTAYKSLDGINLLFERVSFPSHEAAEAAFQIALKESVRIVDREPLYDKKGESVVGERVVAIFPSNDMVKTEWVSSICLDNTTLYRVSSTSLRHIRAFDKAHRRY